MTLWKRIRAASAAARAASELGANRVLDSKLPQQIWHQCRLVQSCFGGGNDLQDSMEPGYIALVGVVSVFSYQCVLLVPKKPLCEGRESHPVQCLHGACITWALSHQGLEAAQPHPWHCIRVSCSSIPEWQRAAGHRHLSSCARVHIQPIYSYRQKIQTNISNKLWLSKCCLIWKEQTVQFQIGMCLSFNRDTKAARKASLETSAGFCQKSYL